ncbi:MAG: ABC transporter permease [Rhodothermales bacterium]|nr:ABC transporter permease [Rhodothermales bacterium]
MLKNYLKIALRTMRQQKLYSGLNILGLALGIGCFLLIASFIRYELSYDRFHPGADRVFRIVERQPNNVFMGSDMFAVTPAPLARTLEADFPQVAHATALSSISVLIGIGDAHFFEQGIWADSSFFDVMPFPLERGDVSTVLRSPDGMAISATLAKRMFGEADPIGQVVEVQYWAGTLPLRVDAVVADVPDNAHFTFDFILPIMANSDYASSLAYWTNNSWYTYFRVREGADQDALQATMPDFVLRHVGAEEAGNYEYIVEPMTDIHLHSDVNFDLGAPGDIRYVYLFGAIGIVILLLAGINYMNLAIARSIKRAKEVGLRQSIGAHRTQIIVQFISESVLMAFFALGLGVLLAWFSTPVFATLIDRPVMLAWEEPLLYPLLAILVLAVGLLSGSYPALYMSRLRPIQSLKGVLAGGTDRSVVQRGLIIFQYTASIVLIAGSLIIYRQLDYIQQKALGYTREHIVTVPIRDSALRQEADVLEAAFGRHPDVVGVTAVSSLPTNIGSSNGVSSWEGREGDRTLSVYQANVGYDFFEVFDIPIVAGRPFTPEFTSDSLEAVILNETAVAALGWTPDTAVGKRFMETGHVVGVMKDFHLHSLHLPIAPMMVRMSGNWYNHLAIRISGNNIPASLAFITETMDGFTDYPVEYAFLDEVFDDLYTSERRLGQAFGYFTFLALLIASLGLFGLAAYASERRSKEIGIRKVLGASVADLVALLSREFLVLVIAALVIAIPVAYFGVRRWLDGFAYRVDLGADVFLIAGALAVVVALVAVAYQALRAALADPVRSLRYE